jgi:hypothetical protein
MTKLFMTCANKLCNCTIEKGDSNLSSSHGNEIDETLSMLKDICDIYNF